MQIEISQSLQFKYLNVHVVKDAISYNCFPTIMQHVVVKNAFISRHQMAQLVFRVPPITDRCCDNIDLLWRTTSFSI